MLIYRFRPQKIENLAFRIARNFLKVLKLTFQEGNELANKKCFSHHYARNSLASGWWWIKTLENSGKFIFFEWKFPLECFRAPAIFLLSFLDTRNQKMIQMTGIKNEVESSFWDEKSSKQKKTIIIYIRNEFELDW